MVRVGYWAKKTLEMLFKTYGLLLLVALTLLRIEISPLTFMWTAETVKVVVEAVKTVELRTSNEIDGRHNQSQHPRRRQKR